MDRSHGSQLGKELMVRGKAVSTFLVYDGANRGLYGDYESYIVR